jgi:CheY-like chemotaxis protein
MLLTHRGGTANLVEGLDSGANDYLAKPFDRDELAARLKVGCEVVRLQDALAARVADLERALAEVKQLRGTLPICAWCKKIRDDANYWRQVEDYLARHTDAGFTHGICPDCLARTVSEGGLTGPGGPGA